MVRKKLRLVNSKTLVYCGNFARYQCFEYMKSLWNKRYRIGISHNVLPHICCRSAGSASRCLHSGVCGGHQTEFSNRATGDRNGAASSEVVS